MELQSLLLPEKVVTFEFDGCPGFKVDLAYLSKETSKNIYQKCLKTEFNKKTRTYEEKLDEEKFLKKYTDAVVKGWKGFKYKYLAELVLTDISKVKPEEELEYSKENALILIRNSNEFDSWVGEKVGDLANFSNIK